MTFGLGVIENSLFTYRDWSIRVQDMLEYVWECKHAQIHVNVCASVRFLLNNLLWVY